MWWFVQEDVDKDPDLTVLWSVDEWKAWPRGLIKGIVRVMWDPIGFFGIFGPPIILALNIAWPQRIAHQSLTRRCIYVAARVVLVSCIFGAWLHLAASSRAHMVVSGPSLRAYSDRQN